MTTIPTNMNPVARDGELILYADIKKEYGILYDELRDIQGDKRPLQEFFKWGNFEPIKK